jgi:transcriptional regulator with XRE-family HTH domain
MRAEQIRYLLHRRRRELHKTLRGLALETGFHWNTIDGWESGHREVGLEKLIIWANFLGYEVELRRKYD